MDMLIANLSLPRDAVALEQTLQTVPELELEAEQIAAHSTAWTMPCLWVASADFDTVDEALQDDPSVEAIVETYEFEDEKYYQLDWSDFVIDRIDAFLDQEASILEAEADAEGWRIQIRFASRDQFDDFRKYLRENDYSFDLLGLTEPGAPRQTAAHVTPAQRAAMVAAGEHGYYAVPREISAEELAAKLEVSQQALSERLRRGTANLVAATLVADADTSEE